MLDKRLKIGVIGGGVSGITVAWLLSRKHDITLIKKKDKLGGHTCTHVLKHGPDSGTPIDMGFIVLNDRTYPILHTLFKQWGVSVQNSDMSFGFEDKATGFYYSSDMPQGLFARRRNLVSPLFWQLIKDIFRFNRLASQSLRTGCNNMTLGQFLEQHHFSHAFKAYHMIPVSAAVWSTPAEKILDFPAESILRFYDHHGLLTLNNRPQWQTVVGGSFTYVRAFEKQFSGEVMKNCPVQAVERTQDAIKVTVANGPPLMFDQIVLATHADISHALLTNPSPLEKKLLSQWSYTPNRITLHTDASVMPPRRSAWASWSYVRFEPKQSGQTMTMSYYMNRLENLNSSKDYL